MKFSVVPYDIVPLWPTHLPQHPIPEYPQVMSLSYRDRPRLTLTKKQRGNLQYCIKGEDECSGQNGNSQPLY
jgi:hypothetical protein